jgi:hypothetical protein
MVLMPSTNGLQVPALTVPNISLLIQLCGHVGLRTRMPLIDSLVVQQLQQALINCQLKHNLAASLQNLTVLAVKSH